MPKRTTLRWLLVLLTTLVVLVACQNNDDGSDGDPADTPIPPAPSGEVVGNATGTVLQNPTLPPGGRPTLPPSFDVNSEADDTSPIEATASLRLVHAIDGVSAIDVLLNDEVIYRNVTTDNITLPDDHPAGEYTLVLSQTTAGRDRTGNEPVYYSGNILLEDNVTLIFLFTGTVDDVQVQVFEEDLSPLEPQQARLSFVNAVAGVASMTAQEARLVLTDSISFGQKSDALVLLPRGYVIDLLDGSTLLDTVEIRLQTGTAYILMAVGTAEDTRIIAVESATPPQTRFRVVHVAPDTLPFQLRLDDQVVAENLQFGEHTDFQLSPSGQYLAEIYLISPDGTVDELPTQIRNIRLDPNQTVELVVFGPDIDLDIDTFAINTDPIQVGESRVMFVHVGYGAGRIRVESLVGEDLGINLNYGASQTVSFVPSRQDFLFYGSASTESVEAGRDFFLEPATVYTYFVVARQSEEPVIVAVDVVERTDQIEETLSTEVNTTAQIIVYNGWDETVEVTFNGDRVAFGLPSGVVSDPAPFETVSGLFEIINTDGNLLYESSIFIEPEEALDSYYLYIVPNGAGIEVLFLPELELTADPSLATLRFVHALPTYDQLAVVWNNNQMLQMFLGSLNEVYTAEPGTITFDVIDRSESVLLFSQEVSVEAGRSYRLIVMEDGDGTPTITVLEN